MLMALIRLLSGSIKIFAAILMFKLNEIVNSSLAPIGPFILVITTAVLFVRYFRKAILPKNRVYHSRSSSYSSCHGIR